MGINALDVKQSNVHTVLWTLCSCKSSTIKDLAQRSGLSYATVGNILNDLAQSDEVLVSTPVTSTGGRPVKVYKFNAEYAHVLALTVQIRNGKNILHASVGNLFESIIWQTEQYLDSIALASFEGMLDSCLQRYPTIRVLSFSLPSAERNGMILNSAAYSELVGFSFAEHFERKYRLPVIVENDVNAAVYGYSRRIEPTSVIAGIYFPRSFPGAGIMVDGKIVKGADGYAGEVAQMPLGIDWPSVDYDNPQEIGPAVARMLCIICSVLNPNHLVVYGDFFTGAVQETIYQIMQKQLIRNVLPFISYESDLNADICSGLIARATSVYRRGLGRKRILV